MRNHRRLGNLSASNFLFLAVCLSIFCAQAGSACDEIPAGQTFRVRLLQPVSSYSSKPGSPVRAMLIESPRCDLASTFPVGTIIQGHIQSVHKVGMGFRHEIATLEIQFDQIEPEGAPPIGILAQVVQVDNAREHVIDGVIHGIRSTNTPQDHISSRVGYLATWDPHTMWILPAYRAVFPVFPEPELYFPAGTDLLLELAMRVPVAGLAVASPGPAFDSPDRKEIERMGLSLPERTTTPKGRVADLVNVAFIGSQSQIESAFQAAGWKQSEAMSKRAAFREIDAFLMLKNNASGPMSRQLLQGEASKSTWEKGLDSLAKRDHLRIWSTLDVWKGEPVWLSASTRDVGANLSLRTGKFVHYVDPKVDEERERVVRDLILAGCVDGVDEVARPTTPHVVVNATGSEMHTDGAIAVVKLRDCNHPLFTGDPDAPALAARPRSRFVRYIRTQVLSTRNLWRENAFYDAYAVTRKSVVAIRRHDRLEREERQNEAERAERAQKSGASTILAGTLSN